LGDLGNDFVLAGGQAMHFMFNKARPTKDFDFVLDVYSLREKSSKVAEILDKLDYEVIPEAKNFQFSKQIPSSKEIMRVEFLGCEKDKKTKNKRVRIQAGLHARDCEGADIALRESFSAIISGSLPSGELAEVKIRVVQPQALVMLKLLAMDDRYRNIRGPEQARHDRKEAVTHAGDIVNIIHANIEKKGFPLLFWKQLEKYSDLKARIIDILYKYFGDIGSPGIQLYNEYKPPMDKAEELILINKAIREIAILIANKR
ncbi:MAG: nucleotidyl transferase AbiEii/AbiGii toxin family protein, partial [bacterium]|nr:nucleotidyl transferase AbiEii/AbiGii toxin family protein [bacterium]